MPLLYLTEENIELLFMVVYRTEADVTQVSLLALNLV